MSTRHALRNFLSVSLFLLPIIGAIIANRTSSTFRGPLLLVRLLYYLLFKLLHRF
jgi:hypothetical protein